MYENDMFSTSKRHQRAKARAAAAAAGVEETPLTMGFEPIAYEVKHFFLFSFVFL